VCDRRDKRLLTTLVEVLLLVEDIASVVRDLSSLYGVNSVVVLNSEGEKIYSWHRTEADQRRFQLSGKDIKDTFDINKEFIRLAGGDQLRNVILRGRENIAVIEQSGSVIVFAFTDMRANLALLLIRVRRVAENLAKRFGGALI